MLCESFVPTLAKKFLKVLEISVLVSIFMPSTGKKAGKSFLSLHLFNISLMVDPVCLIFDLFLSNWSAKYCIFAFLMSFFRFYYMILDFHLIAYEGQLRYSGLLI